MFAAATGDQAMVDKQELYVIAGQVNHVVLQSGRTLAADLARGLLRQTQAK